MAKLGFLGLGLMGRPMAEHLLDAGHEVALWSHTASKARQLGRRKNGVFCGTPAEVGRFAECVFLCVGDSAMSEQTILGKRGVIAGIGKDAVVADCSTISPYTALKIAGELKTKGAWFLDAPCTGSTPGARGGTLTFMVGGPKKIFTRVKPYLEAMGKNFYYCGKQGMGLHAKLSQNLVLANMLQGFVEGIVLAVKAGVDPELMFEILDNSAAKAGLISFKAPQIFKRDFEAAFPLKWMKKDVALMLETGREMGVPLPATAQVHELFQASVCRGYGDEDIAAAVKLFEEWAGVEVKGKNA